MNLDLELVYGLQILTSEHTITAINDGWNSLIIEN